MVLVSLLMTLSPNGLSPPPIAPPPKPVFKKSYVEFDLSPAVTRDGDPGYTIELHVTFLNLDKPVISALYWLGGGLNVKSLTEFHFTDFFEHLDAEIVEGTKIRVYGRTVHGKYYPAVEGQVRTIGLRKEQIPTVKNPPRG